MTMDKLFDGSDAHLLNSQGTLDGCSVCSGTGRVLDGEECQFCMGGTLLAGERAHVSSVNCWCKPYQDDQCPDVWIHNELPSGRA